MYNIVVKMYGRYDNITNSYHHIKESFSPSQFYNFSKDNDARIINVFNSDLTNTNDYSIISITRNSKEECHQELIGQWYDGIFENSIVGKFEILSEKRL